MRTWGKNIVVYFFFGKNEETRNNLFFTCPYTYTTWVALVGHLLGTAVFKLQSTIYGVREMQEGISNMLKLRPI